MNTPFAANYNPNIQVCGQCHNSRGARWDGFSYVVTPVTVTNSVTTVVYVNITTNRTYTNSFGVVTNGNVTVTVASNSVTPGVVSTSYTFGLNTTPSYSRPPHHSPQYNILSGLIQPDYLGGTNYIGCHTLNTNGCAACHVRTEESPVMNTGHTFEPEMANCTVSGCHDGVAAFADAAAGKATLQSAISNGINSLVADLKAWSLAKGASTFGVTSFNSYKEYGWEYTGSGNWGSVGPSASDQTNKVPVGIRQARFNLYMLAYGQSYGIHNPQYSRFLLSDASNKVATATGTLPVPTAFFTAGATNVLKNAVVTFSNASTNATSFIWNFGDSTSSTSPFTTHAYTNVGDYTVSLTAANGAGSVVYTRTTYIHVYNAPVAAFTSDVTNGVAPLTVNYTNQSANATSYSWTLGGTNATTTATDPTAVYHTNGNYTVTLRAINPAATNTLTRTNYISVP
jgi:PKD repeat protein